MDTIREVNRQIADTILMLPDSLVVIVGRQIIETARREQIPVMFHEGTWAERGDLASYGASFVDLGRQAARYMDKILKGAKHAVLPVV